MSQSWGEARVRRNAVLAGAEQIEVVVENERVMGQMGKSWGDGLLLEVHVKVTAVGKPKMVFEEEKETDEFD